MKNILRSSLLFFSIAALTVLSSCTEPGPVNGVGLQLYSVRDAVKTDPVATVEQVGAMGYDFVETAGYGDGKIYGMDPVEFKTLVEENGMKFLGAHTGQSVPDSGSWEVLMPWWDECIAAHKEAGALYIVQPWMGGLAYSSLEGLQSYCDYFNAVGEKCNAAGIRFGYHNHDKEFSTELDGQVVYNYMLENTDPEKVFFQLDLYWIDEGGKVATDYFTKYPGRFLSYHIKDEKELGESGEMDFQSSFDMAETAGAIYNVVEVERYNFDPIESVEKSLEYLKEIGFTK
jgi:sugar phosphate isomerase/epimerase